MKRFSELDIQGRGMTSQRTRDRLIDVLKQMGIQNQRVLSVMSKVPRHLFVDEAMSSRAYENNALPIGYGQTISQPYIVARMTELLLGDEQEGVPEKVLEVGSGSGYQAAVLGGLIKSLHTVERIRPLYQHARDVLYALGYRNVYVHHSDGSWGWEDEAPYDAMMVTAAPEVVPQRLLDQLSIGGKLVIPVGSQGGVQRLQVIIKRSDTDFETKDYEAVQFVPFLTGI
jgi:protein-L-isoaspartate(D-aspartate) O-methyltransferase